MLTKPKIDLALLIELMRSITETSREMRAMRREIAALELESLDCRKRTEALSRRLDELEA